MNGGLTRCADLPIRLVRPSQKQKIERFATFLRLGTPFCLCKAEMGRFAVDLLRFRA